MSELPTPESLRSLIVAAVFAASRLSLVDPVTSPSLAGAVSGLVDRVLIPRSFWASEWVSWWEGRGEGRGEGKGEANVDETGEQIGDDTCDETDDRLPSSVIKIINKYKIKK